MNLSKDKIKQAMKLTSESTHEDPLQMVWAQEQLIRQETLLRPVKKARDMQLEMALLSLRERQYLARYGDYLKITPTPTLVLGPTPKKRKLSIRKRSVGRTSGPISQIAS